MSEADVLFLAHKGVLPTAKVPTLYRRIKYR